MILFNNAMFGIIVTTMWPDAVLFKNAVDSSYRHSGQFTNLPDVITTIIEGNDIVF